MSTSQSNNRTINDRLEKLLSRVEAEGISNKKYKWAITALQNYRQKHYFSDRHEYVFALLP